MKASKQARKAIATTQLRKASAEVPRMARIMALEKEITRKKITEDERRSVGASLLREKLAAAQELAEHRTGQIAAQVRATNPRLSAMSAAMNRPHDPRAAVRSAYTGDYQRLAPNRSQTELSSQVVSHEADSSVRMQGLEAELREAKKEKDGLAIDRISQDLTFEKLRQAHRAGRI